MATTTRYLSPREFVIEVNKLAGRIRPADLPKAIELLEQETDPGDLWQVRRAAEDRRELAGSTSTPGRFSTGRP